MGHTDTKSDDIWDTQTQKVMTFYVWTEGHKGKKSFSLIKVFSYSFYHSIFYFKTTSYTYKVFMQNLKKIGQVVTEKNQDKESAKS